MNTRDALASIEEELAITLTEPADDKRRLSDALWRLLQIPVDGDRLRRAQLLLEIASRYFHEQSDPLSAVEPAALASMLARDSGDTTLLRRALATQGQVLFATGNVGDSLRVLSDALVSAQRDRDLESQSTVLAALGGSFLDAALYMDARECLRRACDIDMVLRPRSFEQATANAKAALCDLYLDDIESGLSRIRLAVDILDRPNTDEERFRRVLAEGTYTRLLLRNEWIGDAGQRAQIAESLANQSTSARAKISAALAKGLVMVYSGETEAGLQYCQAALTQARSVPPALKEAALANVQAFERAGRPEAALALHRELTVILRRTQHDAIHHFAKLFESSTDGVPTGSTHSAQERHVELLEQIALTAEMRDDPTGEHAYRVARLAALAWEYIGEKTFSAADIEAAVKLHDIGKSAIPDQLLLKPDPPSPGERALLERHAAMGAEMIARSEHPLRELAADVARFHHERPDGRGYPEGLVGDGIPMPARVTAVCDAYDAMTHAKAYRPAMSSEDAVAELRRNSGTQFDPIAVSALETVLVSLLQKNEDLDSYLGAAASAASVRVSAVRIFAALTDAQDVSRQDAEQPQLRQQQQRRLVRPNH